MDAAITDFYNFLDTKVSGNKPTESKACYLLGAGEAGLFCSKMLKGKVEIKGFLDETPSKIGQTLDGHKIIDPKTITPSEEFDYYVTIFRSDINLLDLCAKLSNKFGVNFKPFLELFSSYLNEDYYFFSQPNNIDMIKTNTLNLYNQLSSSLSKDKLIRHLKFRYSFDLNYLQEPDLPRFNEIKYLSSPINFIDVGAFDGDTIRDLKKTSLNIGNIHAFEPDPENFEKLSAYLKDNPTNNCYTYPLAISDIEDDYVFFNNSSNASSKISSTGIKVKTDKLDNIIKKDNNNIDIIKYDTEGYEISCLNGSMEYIKTNRPILLVSLYHEPDDIFKISFILQEILDNYEYDIIESGHSGTDLMLYAYPKGINLL